MYHHAEIVRLLARRGADVNLEAQNISRETPLRCAVGEIQATSTARRDPDPDGARQLATVRVLLRLGAGTLPPLPPVPASRATI